MIVFTVILIGVIVSFFFTLDLLQTPKKGRFYLRNFLQLIVSTIPAIYNSLSNQKIEFWVFWTEYFYPSFIISFFIFVIIVYYTHYKKKMDELTFVDEDDEKYSFLYCLQMGFNNFEDFINDKIEKARKRKTQELDRTFKTYEKNLPQFMRDINLALIDRENKYDIESYMAYLLNTFIAKFLSHNDARFTIRKYDKTTNSMKAEISTRTNEKPSDIPLSEKNLITLAMNKKKPIIYSRNKKSHYETNGSLKDKIFDDYVSYCVISKNKIPLLSVNLEVKGTQSVKRMKALVDSTLFAIICDTIEVKQMAMNFNKEAEC